MNLSLQSRRKVSVALGTTGAIGRRSAIFLLLGLTISPALHAGKLDSSIISMFPKDTSELGYADLNRSRQAAWFPQFEAQFVPDCISGFEKFLETAQVQETPSIGQVAWARVSLSDRGSGRDLGRPAAGSGQLVAVAAGQFDDETIKLFLDGHSVHSVQAGPNVLFESQTGMGMSEGYFALIDNQTVAFGPLEGLERILEIRSGNGKNLSENAAMMALINQVNGDAVFWSVLDSTEAGPAVQNLVPEVMMFPEANGLVGKLKGLLISAKASDDVELDFQVDSASPSDAIVLSQLLEAGMLSRRFQASQDNPELAKILDGMRIAPEGSHLDLSLSMTDDQMMTLIERNTFKPSM
jgi:hypothetical protein